MFDKWRKSVDETSADLNIIPVMNLFMVLIPFLLLGAAFVHIGVIPTSTPTKSDESKEEKKEKEKNSVMANLVIKPDELRVSFCCASAVPEESLDPYEKSWSIADGEIPFDELQSVLREVKNKYPESNTVTVMPHDKLPYQKLVAILDRTREEKVGTTRTPAGNKKPEFEPLFPVTVFSKFIPDEQDAEQGRQGGDSGGSGGGGSDGD